MTSSRTSLAVLAALTLALYAPFVSGYWLTDDFAHIDQLEHATFTGVFGSPDAFGFYRPIPQLSLLVDLRIFGERPWVFRLTNLLLHLAVVGAAWLVATMVLASTRGAFLATLGFVLTPKAHPVAVLWPAARAELLMALFSLLTVAFWIRWDRSGARRWLTAACVTYSLALLSKETAVLLPLVLLVLPLPQKPTARRLAGASVLIVNAGALLVVRSLTGAMTLGAGDAHYAMTTPVSRWVRNARNYFWRALPSPLALLLLTGLPSLLARRHDPEPRADAAIGSLAIVAVAWFVTFILPTLPIAGRSELYLYLPGFGICLLVGGLLARVWREAGRTVLAGLVIYVVGAGGYLATRSLSVQRDAHFSAMLVDTLARHQRIRQHSGAVVLVPADPVTEELLRGSVGGYLGLVLRRTLNRSDIDGAIAYPNMPLPVDGVRLRCAFTDGRILIES
jgi:Dolichyl-phosphate-mannose-protein mannosyltransferase